VTRDDMLSQTLDTNSVVKRLEAGGFSRSQAERITEVLNELVGARLVTKTDLELGLAKQTIKVLTWVAGMLIAQGGLIVALVEYFK
jgi:hypothetical protein